MINNIHLDQNISLPTKQPNTVLARTVLQSKPDEVHFQAKRTVNFNGRLSDITAFFQRLTGKKAPEKAVEQKRVEASPETEKVPVEQFIAEKYAEIKRCAENDDYNGVCDAKRLVLDFATPEHVETFVPLLDKENASYVRSTAVQIITQVGTPEQVQKYISPLLKDPDSKIKKVVLLGIEQNGSKDDLKTMLDILDSDSPDDQELAMFAREGVINLAKKDNDFKTDTINRIDPFLKNKDFNKKCLAIHIIGGIGNSDDVPRIQPFLKSKNSTLKTEALIAIGDICSEEQKQEIITPFLRDHDMLIRYIADIILNKPEERIRIIFSKTGSGAFMVEKRGNN